MWTKLRLRLPVLIPAMILLNVLACFLAEVVPRQRYISRHRQIWHKLSTLYDRRPADVDVKSWGECMDWIGIAFANVCFSEGHANYTSMCRFEERVDEALRGQPDFATFVWIGDRLAETGPHGERYMKEWRSQWDDIAAARAFRLEHSRRDTP